MVQEVRKLKQEKYAMPLILIAISTAIMLKNYLFHMRKMVEKLNIKDNVLAFRKIKKDTENLTNIHFASIAFNKIRSFDNCSIIAIDFSDFLGRQIIKFLKESIQDILGVTRLDADYFNIYKSLVNYTYVNKDDVYKLFNIPKIILKVLIEYVQLKILGQKLEIHMV